MKNLVSLCKTTINSIILTTVATTMISGFAIGMWSFASHIHLHEDEAQIVVTCYDARSKDVIAVEHFFLHEVDAACDYFKKQGDNGETTTHHTFEWVAGMWNGRYAGLPYQK